MQAGSQLLGNSFNVHVMTILIYSLLDYVTPLRAPRDHVQLLQHHGQAPAGWCALPAFVQDSRATNQSRDLIQEFLRTADKGGSDVKLSVGIPYRIKAWPRAGIQTQLFEWRLIHGFPWTHPAHINVFEMQAVVNSLQWRLRSKHNFLGSRPRSLLRMRRATSSDSGTRLFQAACPCEGSRMAFFSPLLPSLSRLLRRRSQFHRWTDAKKCAQKIK